MNEGEFYAYYVNIWFNFKNKLFRVYGGIAYDYRTKARNYHRGKTENY